jgi:hypothetical protein
MPPLNLYARVRLLIHLAHETAGAARTRSSLRPLSVTEGENPGNPRAHHAARTRTPVCYLKNRTGIVFVVPDKQAW